MWGLGIQCIHKIKLNLLNLGLIPFNVSLWVHEAHLFTFPGTSLLLSIWLDMSKLSEKSQRPSRNYTLDVDINGTYELEAGNYSSAYDVHTAYGHREAQMFCIGVNYCSVHINIQQSVFECADAALGIKALLYSHNLSKVKITHLHWRQPFTCTWTDWSTSLSVKWSTVLVLQAQRDAVLTVCVVLNQFWSVSRGRSSLNTCMCYLEESESSAWFDWMKTWEQVSLQCFLFHLCHILSR